TAAAEVALSTVSSFRGPLDAGVLTLEALTAAMPYDNEIVVCTMSGEELQRLLREARGREGDSRAYASLPERGLQSAASGLQSGSGHVSLEAKVRVATTDYMARAYADFFPCEIEGTGKRVRDALLREIAKR
ncbi:MAG: 5'-nucleotidase C-terminal domain-containing protein, partial [Thermoanaerobaculia bacterium]